MSAFEVVIARYAEEIKFLPDHYLSNAIVYNKGADDVPARFERIIKLPNVGRESHTYLQHILTNYDNLADVTLFTQGAILGHNVFPDLTRYEAPGLNIDLAMNCTFCQPDMWGRIRHTGKWRREFAKGEMRPAGGSLGDFWDTYIKKPKPKSHRDFRWSHGATFSVSRELIHRKTRNYYSELIALVDDHINPEEGHYFERTWGYVF